MPIYTFQDADTGIEIDVEGDSRPTEADLEPLFLQAYQQKSDQLTKRAKRFGAVEEFAKGLMPSNWPSITSQAVRNVREAISPGSSQLAEQATQQAGQFIGETVKPVLDFAAPFVDEETRRSVSEGVGTSAAGLVAGLPEALPLIATGAAGPAAAATVASAFSRDMIAGGAELWKQANQAAEEGDSATAKNLRTQSVMSFGMGIGIPAGAPVKSAVKALRERADLRAELDRYGLSDAELLKAQDIALDETIPNSAMMFRRDPKIVEPIEEANISESKPKEDYWRGVRERPEGGRLGFQRTAEETASTVPEMTRIALERETRNEASLAEELLSLERNKPRSDIEEARAQAILADKARAYVDAVNRRWLEQGLTEVPSTDRTFSAIDEILARARFLGEGYENAVSIVRPPKPGTKIPLEPAEGRRTLGGKVSFAAEAPTLLRTTPEVPEAPKPFGNDVKLLDRSNRISAELERVSEPTALTPTKLEDTPLPVEAKPTEVADAGKKQSPMEMAGGEPPRPAGEMAEGVAPDVRKPEGAQQPKPAEVQPADAAKAPEVAKPSPKGQALGIVPQGSIILDKLINNKKLRSWLSRSFTKERGLPEDAYILELKRRGFTAEQGVRIRNAASDLRDSIADYLKLNRTLTSVAGFRGKAEPQLMRQINDVLNNNDSVNSLPHQLRDPVMNMRNHIDELSRQLMDTGMLSDRLLSTVDANLGTYLTRSFRVFDDPKWIIDNIPVDVVNNARRIIEAEYGVDTPQAMSILRNMFEDWKNGGVEGMFKGRKLGAKDLSSLMMRNEHIRPEFLALMGEYKDPFVNYTRTAAKIARMIADHQFLTGIKEIGMGRFLFEDGRNPSGYNTLISSEGNRAMDPLNGLRTSEHMARVFNEWNKVSPETLPIIKAYYAMNTFSKMSKTVYSAMTQSLNALGQLPMFIANGHYNPMYARDAVRYLRAEIGNNKRWREYQQKLAKHNLVREGVFYGELRDSLKDFSKAMADSDYAPTESMATLMMKNGLAKGPQTLYRVPDEFGKVFGWECEKARMRRDNPTWSEDRVETEAALRIRNTYPTYSNVSEIGGFTKLARRVPFVGPFFPFTYEAIRTTGHNLRYAWDDINSGKIRSGTERLVGTLAAVASLNLGAQALSRMLTGVSKEDDRDLRRQLPEYAKNDAFIYTGKRPGKMDFVNISRYNPYSYVSQPFIAAYIDYGENNDKESALWEFAAEALRPFVGEQMLSKSIREAYSGKTEEGRDVFNPEEDWHAKWEKGLKHVLKNALLPGTIDRAVKRLMPAIRKEPGQESTPSKEIIAEFTGFRQQTHDFKESILRKSGPRFVDGIRNSAKIFSTGIRSQRPSENILGQYIESEDARFRIFSDLYKDVRAALRQGVSKRDVFLALNESGVSKETARSIINGKYIPYKPSDEMIKDARKVNKELPMREMGDIYRARSKMFLDDQRGQ